MTEHMDGASAPAQPVSRRRFIRLGAMAAGSILIPGSAMAGLLVVPKRERSVSFYNLHTGESLRTVYFENGSYVKGALDEVNYILRDFRRNEIKPIDPRLLDLLVAVRSRLDTSACFDVISGYRSPKTNAMLHALNTVRRAAISLQGGGVGYYPKSGFVHLDTGRVRRW
jgi:uncharacterized protein YcbK (DUF882 family)